MLRGLTTCRHLLIALLAGVAITSATGCHVILPDVSHQPLVHNPFPQLSRIAVAPFFNQSDEPTVDGRVFALAYYSELQVVPGFEVVPLGVVEEAILEHRIDLSHPDEARRLARILGVDAVVVGSVTDYTPYYPPRCGMRVEWFSANPGFHEIPPGYGLPWGTPEEEFIPAPLVFEAEMALARAQLATQSPACEMPINPPPAATPTNPPLPPPESEVEADDADVADDEGSDSPAETSDGADADEEEPAGELAALYEEQLPAPDEKLPAPNDEDVDQSTPPGDSNSDTALPALQPEPEDAAATTDLNVAHGAHHPLPPDWSDERGFVPPPPSPVRPPCCPNNGPVMTHTRIYHGADSEFTEALASYYHFRDDARFGGWQNYLQRSDDFIRFCCHMHIAEMLSARGGAGETRVVWRWSESR